MTKKDKKVNKTKKRGKFHWIFRTILGIFVIFCGIVIGLLLGVAVGCILTTSPIEIEDVYASDNTTTIYDSDGNVIQELHAQNMNNSIEVSIDEIPEDLQHAFVAIEDERFYTHNGVDIKRTLSAVIGFVVPGMSSHGGSTITQQLVKNITGDDSRSVPRKIREQWRAIQLEKEIGSKDKILELYLNKIYFANNCYGVETAAQKYFGKTVSRLDLAECAFIAGITNNPAKYNPATTKGRANAYARQITILDNMLDQGYITQEQYIEAIQEELVFAIDNETEETEETSYYTYFVDSVIRAVRNDLVEKGYTTAQANNIIYNQGISIYSTQDTEIQEIVDDVYCDDTYFSVNVGRDPEDCAQSACVIMDQYSGKVVAIYGGYGEKTSSLSYNRATDIERQPGSAIKPILVYGPLIDKKIITSGTSIDETAVKLDSQNPDNYWPRNYDYKVHGFLSARYALKQSYNIPAVEFFEKYMSLCTDYLKNSGIDRTNEKNLSLAIGGLQEGVSPLEMCAAYSVLSNGGTYYEPIFYTKVYSADGELLLDNTSRTGTQVYENIEATEIITQMLMSGVYDRVCTGSICRIYIDGAKLPVAAKTGTTTDTKDYWLCGYSAYYTGAVWYGYDNSTAINTKTEVGAAQYIWKAIMQRIHQNLEIKDFNVSKNIVRCKVCRCSGLLATATCEHDGRDQCIYEEYYLEGTEPTEYCTTHTEVWVCTACQDEFGKNCLATDKCFENGTAVLAYGTMRDEETYNSILESYEKYPPTDWEYELSHTMCTACGGTELYDPLKEETDEEDQETADSETEATDDTNNENKNEDVTEDTGNVETDEENADENLPDDPEILENSETSSP